MRHAEQGTRVPTSQLVIREILGGYEVYDLATPDVLHTVQPEQSGFSCDCLEWAGQGTCPHAIAVQAKVGVPLEPTGAIPFPAQPERQPRRRREAAPVGPQLTLKRSVSPDGRIDSLSVELSYPNAPDEGLANQAEAALRLQSQIIRAFLGTHGRPNKPNQQLPSDRAAARPAPVGVLAELVSVGAMQTRYGSRLFINVQVNGDTLKLFGSPKQLAEQLAAAGYPHLAQHLSEGSFLRVPCRVTTKPSNDGRYVNVDQVFPANGARS